VRSSLRIFLSPPGIRSDSPLLSPKLSMIRPLTLFLKGGLATFSHRDTSRSPAGWYRGPFFFPSRGSRPGRLMTSLDFFNFFFKHHQQGPSQQISPPPMASVTSFLIINPSRLLPPSPKPAAGLRTQRKNFSYECVPLDKEKGFPSSREELLDRYPPSPCLSSLILSHAFNLAASQNRRLAPLN